MKTHFFHMLLNSPFPITYKPVAYYPPNTELLFCHMHSHMEIGYCLEGTGTFILNDEIYTYKKGDITIIFPYESHICNSEKQNGSSWYFIDMLTDQLLPKTSLSLNLEKHMLSHSKNSILIHEENYPEISQLLNLLVAEISLDSINKEYIRGLLMAFFSKVININHSQDIEIKHNTPDINTILPALKYISAHYVHQIEIEQLAKLCYISVPHFRRLFKQHMNTTPLDYILSYRINASIYLLSNTNLSITDIYKKVGFVSQSSYSRSFKKVTGYAPTKNKKRI